MTEPIPNKDHRCRCHLGKPKDDEAVLFYTTANLVPGFESFPFAAYRDCPLHGEYVKMLVKDAMKGLNLG